MPSPLFSTYRQGENRVSASILAVFERFGIDLVASILGASLERPELALVQYTAQLAGGGPGVPDGEMRANFRFLFEVKTEIDQIAGHNARHQIDRHLARLTGGHEIELLIVLTPDRDIPPMLDEFNDARVAWVGFEALTQAMTQLLEDPSEPASEQQRFLLRELIALFELDGLVGYENVVVVAAGTAYDTWRNFGAYVCQAERAFRSVTHWGFYRSKRIEPEFPRVIRQFHEVGFTREEATRLQTSEDVLEVRLGDLIADMLATGQQDTGAHKDVVLLQRTDDPDLTTRAGPIPHESRGAWTQQQRYAHLDALLTGESTADL